MFRWNIILLVLLFIVLVELKRIHRKHKNRIVLNSDDELRRTKRTIFQALLKRKLKYQRSSGEEGISVDQYYPKTTRRPFVNKQVQELRIQIKAVHEWRDEMNNVSSPEYLLFAGNIIDDFGNEFEADFNYLSAKVTKLTKTNIKDQILADVTFRFYKTADDPLLHLQGVVSKGWVGGQKVDPEYFRLIASINANKLITKPQNPDEVKLRIVPAMKIANISDNVSNSDNILHYNLHHQNYTKYKEIRISIKLKQKYVVFLQDKKSPEYSTLSGNVEEAVMKVFSHDDLYIDAEVLDFRESSEGRVIVNCAVKFKLEEKFAIEKCQAMISSGDLEGMPVDDRFFIVNSLKEYGTSQVSLEQYGPSNTSIPIATPVSKKNKPKPLRYKELRISIKTLQPWNISFSDNTTKFFSVLSGAVETAVDRALADNPYYIDDTVVEFLESREFTTIANIAIRFKLEEMDPEGKARDMIKGGLLSGLPVDERFFYVFSLSETIQPDSETISNVYNTSWDNNNNNNSSKSFNFGQKQQAALNYTPQILPQVDQLRPLQLIPEYQEPINQTLNYILTKNQSQPLYSVPPITQELNAMTAKPPVTTAAPSYAPEITTFNPYLPKADEEYLKEQKQPKTINPDTIPTFNPYLPNKEQVPNQQMTAYKPVFPVTHPPVNGQPVSLTQTEAKVNTVEGSMTLEQTWHPYLSDMSSQVYRILEQTVVNAIRSVYTEANEEVVPEVLGFSETNIPTTSIAMKTEKKVAVRFKVLFTRGHRADPNPLVRAVSLKSVAGMLIHENSLVAVANPANSEQYHEGTSQGRRLTLCQEQQREAESASEGMIGGFVPQCNNDGSYKTTQCHALIGYCWCVNENGVRLQGTEAKYKEPNCNGITFRGNVIFPEHSPEQLPSNSCLTVSLQEMILCGGNISCHIPLIANETFRNLQLENHSLKYELNTARLKPGKYLLSAVINVGWCRVNSYKSKDLIHQGDYHSTTLHDVLIDVDTRVVQKDIEVEVMLPEETGVLLYGKVLLPADSPLISIPAGSCLSIETKQLNVCTGSKCPLLPISGNTTITDIELIDNTIPYSMHLPELDPGTYVISAVLHVGPCRDGDQSMIPGDYFNDEMHDYTIASHTTEINKDIKMVKLKDPKAGGVFVSGRVLMPVSEPPLLEGSCLTISSRKLIQCKYNNCKIPPVASKIFENVTNDGGIPYTLLLPVATPGKYIISAVVNNGWCKTDGNLKDWIRPGDFYNTKVHDFEIKQDTLFVGKNIKVTKFEPEIPKPGVTIHGRVILPESSNETFSSRSCLTIKAQEFKLCGGGANCMHPLTTKETFRDFRLEVHTIPYAIVIPNIVTGHFIISALLNVDWCKDDDVTSPDFIHNGDYHNEETHDFVISEGMTDILKDIKLEEYNDIVTSVPSMQPSYKTDSESELSVTNQPQTFGKTVSVKQTNPELAPTSVPSFKIMTEPSRPVISIKSEITTPLVDSTVNSSMPITSDISQDSDIKKLNLQISTQKPAWFNSEPVTIGVGQLYELSSKTPETTATSTSTAASENELITLPAGLPKSCQEIRDAGIGRLDGQYIIEARPGCHLSIICQDMEDKLKSPKEFLGGPSEDEWKYWHYAVLIKLSYQDKLNMPSGACLEKSDAGKGLIKRVLIAGAKQGTPLSDWKTNVSKLLTGRYKRDGSFDQTVITRAVTIYKNPEGDHGALLHDSKWGVL